MEVLHDGYVTVLDFDGHIVIKIGNIFKLIGKFEYFKISPNRERIAIVETRARDGKKYVVLDGKEIAEGSDIYFQFSPTSCRYICVVHSDEGTKVIVDGNQIGIYDTVSHIHWWRNKYCFVGGIDGQCELVIDGEKQRYPFIWACEFGPNGEVINVIKTNRGAAVKVDGRVIDISDDIRYFRVDNNCIIYDAVKGRNMVRIVRRI